MTREQNLNQTPSDGMKHKPLKAKTEFNKIERPTERPKKKSLRQGLKEVFYEYCSNSSINGVQYFGQRRPWTEIILWACLLIVSAYCCAVSVRKVYDKWVETPVIVSFSEKSTDIWTIPFPAVTICSETKRKWNRKGPSYKNLLNDLHENGQQFQPNISSIELDEFLTLLHICNAPADRLPHLSHPPIDYIRIINEMSADFGTYFPKCKLTSRKFSDCDIFFTKTYTEDGLCFTFNGLNGTDLYRENTVQYTEMGLKSSVPYSEQLNRSLSWSLEQGYAPNSALNTYPARVLSSGSRAGLTLYLQTVNDEVDYGCRGARQGFKLLVHSPDDVPLVSKQYVRIAMGNEILISVKPNMMTTSDGIAEYAPDKRLCYLSGERYLKFFKVYTENNCELECLTNFTLNRCGCVKFSMPRTPDMPVCGEENIDCYEGAEDELMKKDFSGGLQGSNNKCNCMPACTSLEFDKEISQGNLQIEHWVKAENFKWDHNSELSYVSIYYKDNEFITSKRSEMSGLYDFLSDCGGILGLFTGFSILSAVELLYHFTLRLWSNMRRGEHVEALQ